MYFFKYVSLILFLHWKNTCRKKSRYNKWSVFNKVVFWNNFFKFIIIFIKSCFFLKILIQKYACLCSKLAPPILLCVHVLCTKIKPLRVHSRHTRVQKYLQSDRMGAKARYIPSIFFLCYTDIHVKKTEIIFSNKIYTHTKMSPYAYFDFLIVRLYCLQRHCFPRIPEVNSLQRYPKHNHNIRKCPSKQRWWLRSCYRNIHSARGRSIFVCLVISVEEGGYGILCCCR